MVVRRQIVNDRTSGPASKINELFEVLTENIFSFFFAGGGHDFWKSVNWNSS